MNATAVETLERRLDATRRALIGEHDRLKAAVEAAAHAAGMVTQIEDGIRKSEQIIADLTAALEELRGWGPQEPLEAFGPTDEEVRFTVAALAVRCPSCGAKPGEPCTTASGSVATLAHSTRVPS